MNRRTSLALPLAVVGLASLIMRGCATPDDLVARCGDVVLASSEGPMLVGKHYGREMSPLPVNAVQFTDEHVARTVAVQNVASARTDTNTVRVAARMFNCSRQPQVVRVRTHFLDERSMNGEPVSAWRLIALSPRSTAQYEERSVSSAVSSFLIELAKESP